jgi:8-oxo-dGTP pyrophosphatase MutT (NUDIX family)
MDTSFKAVLLDDTLRVLLGTNPRQEWELLGGRADPQDRDPRETIRRELAEEAGLDADIGPIIDIWYYDIPREGRVAVASYLARPRSRAPLLISPEHTELHFFSLHEIDKLAMPSGYKTTIRRAHEFLREST